MLPMLSLLPAHECVRMENQWIQSLHRGIFFHLVSKITTKITRKRKIPRVEQSAKLLVFKFPLAASWAVKHLGGCGQPRAPDLKSGKSPQDLSRHQLRRGQATHARNGHLLKKIKIKIHDPERESWLSH